MLLSDSSLLSKVCNDLKTLDNRSCWFRMDPNISAVDKAQKFKPIFTNIFIKGYKNWPSQQTDHGIFSKINGIYWLNLYDYPHTRFNPGKFLDTYGSFGPGVKYNRIFPGFGFDNSSPNIMYVENWNHPYINQLLIAIPQGIY